MIITFSKHGPAHVESAVIATVGDVSSSAYAGNVYASITWANGRRVRFTLGTRDSHAHGSRRSASGRHMPKASWEAHRDVLQALFALDPDATIRTALATYRGRADFRDKFPATAHKNVGSTMCPVTFRETTV